MPLRGRRFLALAGGSIDPVVASVTRTPTSIDATVGDVVTFSLQAKNAANQSLIGRTYSAVSASPSIVRVDSVVGRVVTCTILAETGGVNVVGTCETVDALACSIAGTGTGTDLEDPLVPFLTEYDNGYFDAYDLPNGVFDGTEVLVTTTRLGTPAIASIVAPDDIILAFTNGAPTLTDASPYANDKGYRITKSDHTSGMISGSAGPAGTVVGGADPDLVVDDPDTLGWFSGDSLPIAGQVHVRSIDDIVDHISVTPSTLAPAPHIAYTADIQLRSVSADVPRFDVPVTISYSTVSGPGDGSVTDTAVRTNKDGKVAGIRATSGANPTIEQILATDGTHTGASADIVVQSSVELVFAIGKSSHDASSGALTDAADTSDIEDLDIKMLLIIASGYADAPAVSDTESNIWVERISTGDPIFRMFQCVNPTIVNGMQFFAGAPSNYTGIVVVGFSSIDDVPDDDENYALDYTPRSVDPAFDNELIVAAYHTDNVGAVTVDNGYTIAFDLPYVSGLSLGAAVAYLVQAAKAITTTTFTPGSSTFNPKSIIATFKRAP